MQTATNRTAALALALGITLGLGPASSHALDSGGTCHGTRCEVEVRSGLDGTAQNEQGQPARHSNESDARPAPGEPAAILIHVAACPGNEPGSEANLCEAARICPTTDQLAFWVYIRRWNASTKAHDDPVLVAQPPYVCLGPEEAQRAQQVDPRLAVIARVRRDWRNFGLPAAVVVTQPAEQTLVGAETRFLSKTPATATLPPKPVLGMDVTLSIRATGYEWDFGDGTVLEAAADGGKPRSEHTYRDPGVKEVRLRTFYSATFTIAGSPTVYPLEGTADVPGRVTVVRAREARTELVDG